MSLLEVMPFKAPIWLKLIADVISHAATWCYTNMIRSVTLRMFVWKKKNNVDGVQNMICFLDSNGVLCIMFYMLYTRGVPQDQYLMRVNKKSWEWQFFYFHTHKSWWSDKARGIKTTFIDMGALRRHCSQLPSKKREEFYCNALAYARIRAVFTMLNLTWLNYTRTK